MLVFLACTCCSKEAASSPPIGPKNVMGLMRSIELDPSSKMAIASGKLLKLPSLADLTAELNKLG